MPPMNLLSNRINNLSESATIRMNKLGRELKAKGIDVISLSFGETDFNTPDYIKAAAKEAIDSNYSFYTPVSGYADLRKAISEKLDRENGLKYAFDQIVVSTGAKQCLTNALLCLVNPGDEVIIPTPYWVSYSEMVKLAEGKAVFLTTGIDNDFKITASQLEESITSKTKVFMFSSPNNPTGSVYTREELAGLAAVFERHPSLYIISDEIYEHINFSQKHVSIAEFQNIKDRVIIVNGLSKAFAMTGWRLGFSASNKEIAVACDKLQGQVTSATCSISQRAALAAYNGNLDTVKEMKTVFKARRDMVFHLLSQIDGLKVNEPQGAFYFFPDVSNFFGRKTPDGDIIKTSTDIAYYLLYKAHVAVVSGIDFGDDSCIRLSYAASTDILKEAMLRIKNALSLLS